MQYLSISASTTLSELKSQVGSRNVDAILNLNSIPRQPNVGQALNNICNAATSNSANITAQRKSTILNTFTANSDIFETAALLSEDSWKMLSNSNTFPDMLKIPETILLPDSADLIGNNEPVTKSIYDKAMSMLQTQGYVDPVIFNEYSSKRGSQLIDASLTSTGLQWFPIPWGDVTLYSSLTGTSMDFPVYPEDLSDSRKANYDTMPDMLYQYEPWYVFKGSGPRSNTYTFTIHRDMWSGDHRDGKCNELVRFCEASCYADYQGAAIATSTVTLYIGGQAHISGIVTDVSTEWSGPLGQDKFYLMCKLSITISEVSAAPLSYTAIRNKGLIG